MQEIKQCPICESTDFTTFLKVKDHSISKEEFEIKQCTSCGFKITSPRPSDQKLPSYYQSEDYVSHSDTKKGVINFMYQKVKAITLKQKEKLIAGFKTSKTVLDIGCGTGDFLKYLSDKNWKITGLEPDKGARSLALAKLPGNIFPIENFYELPHQNYGIITMWHVLEHVSELNKYMKQLYLILENDGRLIIALPNPDSADAKHYKEFWAAYDVPRHLFHFSKKDITALATKHGFKLESIKPMLFDSFYVSMLSEKYKNGNILKAANNGLISNIKGSKNTNHSSLIYIFSKSSLK
jgi:2-polyprenyl-3-methyl-5-hydroxy-6-metoxy-1,4-benzoquinol methylase